MNTSETIHNQGQRRQFSEEESYVLVFYFRSKDSEGGAVLGGFTEACNYACLPPLLSGGRKEDSERSRASNYHLSLHHAIS